MTQTASKKCNIFTAKAIRYQCARSLTDKWIHNWSYLILQWFITEEKQGNMTKLNIVNSEIYYAAVSKYV